MNFINLLGLLLLSTSTFTMRLNIKEILPPDDYSDSYLVFVSNGEVLELSPSKEDVLSDIKWAFQNTQSIEIDILKNNLKSRNKNKRSHISQVKLISNSENNFESILDYPTPTPMNNYRVARASSVNVIKQMFLSMRRDLDPDSQCYNRAHIWSHDLSTKFLNNRKINLGKAWLFFTKKYIREFNYKWWFHVAPYTYLKGDDREIILDRTYYHSPRRIQNWTNYFMKNNSVCKRVQYYSDYNNNQESAYCYLIKSSMYYYQPYQIENLEKGGAEKFKYLRNELELAYKDAL